VRVRVRVCVRVRVRVCMYVWTHHPSLLEAGRPVEAPAEVKAPKALLQQHCKKRGIPPPRFDKLPLGGQRMEKAGLRYSVTLEPPLPTGPRRKGATRPAPHTFSVPEDDDGWEAIQDAQNAAAAFALFKVRFVLAPTLICVWRGRVVTHVYRRRHTALRVVAGASVHMGYTARTGAPGPICVYCIGCLPCFFHAFFVSNYPHKVEVAGCDVWLCNVMQCNSMQCNVLLRWFWAGGGGSCCCTGGELAWPPFSRTVAALARARDYHIRTPRD
jgi:hypothetical protein